MGRLEHAETFDLLETRDHLEQVFCKRCIGLYGDGATIIPNVSFVMSGADRRHTNGDTFASISQQ
jgi:uncharacterized protein with ACT and thioredoxin-like domain